MQISNIGYTSSWGPYIYRINLYKHKQVYG